MKKNLLLIILSIFSIEFCIHARGRGARAGSMNHRGGSKQKTSSAHTHSSSQRSYNSSNSRNQTNNYYNNNRYWGGAGLGLTSGVIIGTAVASSKNSGSQSDPRAEAQADQMRYDLKKEQAQDLEKENIQKNINNREQKIKELQQEIAALKINT